MRTPLKVGTIIQLNEIGTKKSYDFKITEIIGMGGSCIVYTAVYTDSEDNKFMVRLKEFYPEWLKIAREKDALIIENNDEFHDALLQFTEGYRRQMQFRMMPESMNSISNIQGIYEGNSTRYIAMSCQNAIQIDDADLTLYDIFRVIRAVTLQIANFHDNGYLYLDLKPQNVMLYPETPEMVMLFDFDSAVRIDDIQPQNLSCTDSWGAPELLQRKFRDISPATDIYGIGALLMYLLFHRPPSSFDRRNRSDWEEELDNSLLRSEKPEVRRMVTEIFRKTLTSNPQKRFQSCDDLLDLIELYIEENQNPKPYLKTFLPLGNNYFCGRDREISEIHKALTDNHFLMLHGIGGIGKSELAKHYALAFAKEYDAAVFVRFQGNIVDTITNDTAFPLVNCQRGENESTSDYYNRKLQILHTVCTQRHLIILDNFDTEECDHLDDLLGLPCKILITSRINYSDIFPQIDVNTLDNFENIRSIFKYYWTGTADEYVDGIIYALYGHTMGVELVSRQMQAANISSKEMYERLSAKGVSATEEKIRNFKDGSIRNKSAKRHLEILFTVFGLSDELINILNYLAMFGTTTVSITDFFMLCDFDEDEKKDFWEAVQRGWVQVEDERLHLHPLICEVLLSQLKPDIEDTWRLIKSLEEGAEILDQLPADKRSEREYIMHHVAEHIYGEPAILVSFLKGMEEVYITYHEYEKAEKCLLKRMELSETVWPDSPEQYQFEYYNLADYAQEQGAYDRAEMYRQKANELVPEYCIWLKKYSDAYDDDDFEKAKQYALKLVELADNPKYLRYAYNYLANAEECIDADSPLIAEYGKQELYYAMKCIEQNTDNNTNSLISLWSAAAKACMHVGNYEKAVCHYLKILDLEKKRVPENTVSKFFNSRGLGIAYACLQNKSMAMKTLENCLVLIQEHYLPEHPKYEELTKILAAAYNICYSKTNDEEYLYMIFKILDLLLQVVEDIEELGLLEIQYANALPLVGMYDECEEHIQKEIMYYSEAYDEEAIEWIDVLSYVWQLLFMCDNPDWEKHFDHLIELCDENDMEEVKQFNIDLLEEYTKED